MKLPSGGNSGVAQGLWSLLECLHFQTSLRRSRRRLKQSSLCINRSRNTCAMTDNSSLRSGFGNIFILPSFLHNLKSTPLPSPVLDLLHAHRVSPKLLRNKRLNLFAIRTRFTPSVRKSALPWRGDKVISPCPL